MELPLVESRTETLELKFKVAKGVVGRRIYNMTEDEVDEVIHRILDEDVELLELLR